MSVLSSIEDTTKEFFSGGQAGSPPLGLTISNINVGAVLEVVNAIVTAAPSIVNGLVSATPFVEAICELISNGGKPSDAQWADLRTRLDANSGILANAENAAQAELDAAAAATAVGDGPADVPAAEGLLETSVPTGKKGK